MSGGAFLIIVIFIIALSVGGYYVYQTYFNPSNDASASRVQNTRLTILADGATGKQFAFSWDPPKNGSGAGYQLTYAYTITDPNGGVTNRSGQTQALAPIPTPYIDGSYKITVTAANQFGAGPAATATGTLNLKPRPFPATNAIRYVAPGGSVDHPTPGYYFEWDPVSPGDDATATVTYSALLIDPTGKQYKTEGAATKVSMPQPVINGAYRVSVYAKNQYGMNRPADGSTTIALLKVRSAQVQWVPSAANDGSYAMKATTIVENMPSPTTPLFSLIHPDGTPVPLAPGSCGYYGNEGSTCSTNSDGSQTCTNVMQPIYGAPNLSSLSACTAIEPTGKSMRNMPVNLKVDVIPQNALVSPASLTVGTTFPGTAPGAPNDFKLQ
ncbi:hypothetical protein QKT49_gp397 [Acanthamoeba castellanii medusavirus]|uniref:Membrane protein n=1 Tax=Acanthamoeba castellanii medusavirus J1 TaxID=3114988 RepID=A0A3T1CX15_9VIRU|nr:hypothetical protein QKT49_gp397 [Acanthamoeba castellanii medusavirus]BBI30366.1 putative membrane protein [Acanthamoeba castellanii medusavirus J1]